MNVYGIVLFVHLVASLALFVGYGIEWTASALFRSAANTDQLRAWLRVFKVSPPLSGAGLGILILSGGYLGSLTGAMKQGWVSASLIGIFVVLALGFAFILPRMRAIRTALPTGNEPIPPGLRPKLTDPLLLTAIRVRVLLATGIVFLMVAKLPFITSLSALALAVTIGLLCSFSTWRQPAAN
jgi:hypothetical protein